MINKMRRLQISFIVVVTIAISAGLVFTMKQELNEAYVVTLENGITFKATRVNWYNSGIADIRKKDGERIQIPTRLIKQVKFTKK